MKKIILPLIIFFTSTAFAQPDSATMMKNWETYMTPGPMHKMMASWNGKWTGDVSMWHAPGTPAEKSTTVSENEMIMGGRYQESEHEGNMMGMPFKGLSLLAYDNAKKVFVQTWIDNVGTGMMIAEGPWDEKTKTITLKGEMVDPAAGNGSMVKITQTYQIVDNNNHVMSMFMNMPDGTSFKTMEIKMKRK